MSDCASAVELPSGREAAVDGDVAGEGAGEGAGAGVALESIRMV